MGEESEPKNCARQGTDIVWAAFDSMKRGATDLYNWWDNMRQENTVGGILFAIFAIVLIFVALWVWVILLLVLACLFVAALIIDALNKDEAPKSTPTPAKEETKAEPELLQTKKSD